MTEDMFEMALLRLAQDYPTVIGDFEYREDWIKHEIEQLPVIGLPNNWDSKIAGKRYKYLYEVALGKT